MYTSVITKADKQTLQEDGSVFLDVEFDILFDDEVVDTKRLAFGVDTTAEEIATEIKNYTENYQAEVIAKNANAEKEAQNAKVDEVIADIIGMEVTSKK